MKAIIEIPEEVLKTRYYTDYFGCGSHKLTETLDNATPIPDNAVTWVDFEHLRDKIIRLSCRYSIARERGCGGQVEWSDRLIKQEDVLKAFEEYQKGGKK